MNINTNMNINTIVILIVSIIEQLYVKGKINPKYTAIH